MILAKKYLSRLAFLFLLINFSCREDEKSNSAPLGQVESSVSFDTEIKPIVAAKCSPCHSAGAKIGAKYDFTNSKNLKAADPSMLEAMPPKSAGPGKALSADERKKIAAFIAAP